MSLFSLFINPSHNINNNEEDTYKDEQSFKGSIEEVRVKDE